MEATATPATPYLLTSEIEDLCAPLKQGFAQTRYLCTLLGVAELPRRPDGTPIVGRKLVEERLNGQSKARSPAGFKWSK